MTSTLLFVMGFLLVVPVMASAEASGPDYWEVRNVDSDDVLNIRAKSTWRSAKIGEIPFDGRCVENFGCVGGFSSTDHIGQGQKKKKPLWCKIKYQGTIGWVAGRYLGEGRGDCDQTGDYE